MGNTRKRRKVEDSSSSDASSSDEVSSSNATTPTRSSGGEAQRNSTRKKEDKVYMRILELLMEDRRERREQLKKHTREIGKQLKKHTQTKDDVSEMRVELKKLTESVIELRKQLAPHINGSSGDDAAAPRSESSLLQLPRYRLEFRCKVKENITKGKFIETINHDEVISVALFDDHDQLVQTGPFASATVKLVVVNGEFNQHDNQCNWSREDFERNIVRPPGGNSATGDVYQSGASIVRNSVFKLIGGVRNHGDAEILYNSSNKKVRLGVMVLSPMEERVLEGLSNSFFVRGHDRPARQEGKDNKANKKGSRRQGQAPAGYGCGEQNGSMQNPSVPHLDQLSGSSFDPAAVPPQLPENTTMLSGFDPVVSPQLPENTTLLSGFDPVVLPQLPENTTVLPTGQLTSGSRPLDQFYHSMYETSRAQATHGLLAGGEQLPLLNGFVDPNLAPHNYYMGNAYLPVPTNGTQLNRNTLFPVQLMWDRPNVDPSKSWNLLDQLMPLYSCQAKHNNFGLPTMRLMTEHLGSLSFKPKELMQTRRNKGVLIEPLEPDDSDEERPLKRRLHSKYRLRFMNKVCEAYYKGEQIKADDGNLVKVALVDETNSTITSGPLSSASVEIVVLHGDFNVDGQDYWTSQEFSRCIVCSGPGKEATVLGGDRILVLADGEACLGDSFFRTTSLSARTGKFMMGVMLASAQDERIQEGISEPFLVRDRPSTALGPLRRPLGLLDLRVQTQFHRSVEAADDGRMRRSVEVDLLSNEKKKTKKTRAEVDHVNKEEELTTISLLHGNNTRAEQSQAVDDEDKSRKTSEVSYHDSDSFLIATACSWKDERIEEGISEPFLVRDRRPWKGAPIGFRFHPTDEEIMVHYLRNRAAASPGLDCIIAEVDIYKFNPWDLPAKAVIAGDDEWYFFCPWNGRFTSNRAAVSGYWAAIGTGKPIITNDGELLGFKKALVFYEGSAPAGVKTRWIMHEYYGPTVDSTKGSSSTSSITLEEWALCKIHHKDKRLQLSSSMDDDDEAGGLGQPVQESIPCTDLPPGFRFHPTDQELIVHYLRNRDTASLIIPDIIDLSKMEPWDIPDSAIIRSDCEWYFFSPQNRKYCTGQRVNRATEAGYWKATGKDKPVTLRTTKILGFRKTLVFYTGRAPRGAKTGWMIHEYRLADNNSPSSSWQEWFLCRLYKDQKQLRPSLSTAG